MKSLWLDTVKLPEFPQLRKDIKTDVLIIGGGIAGILTAYYLHQKGVKYILVEKDTICSHTTGNTTAKITFQHGLIYHKILKSWGFNTAKMYLEANKLALKSYNELCENINCDHQVKDKYVYTLDNRKKLEDEYYALDKIGYNAQLCEYTSLPFKTLGAIKFTNQAQFNPLKFISQISKSLNIYEQTFVKEMAGNTAITNNSKINADKIIVATHFPFINKHGSYFLKLYQHRSYVIALENANKLNGMYVDENKKGHSFRNQGDFLLIGGGSHRTGKNGGNWNELRAFADIYYPNLNEKYHWSTQDCMSLDSIPYIGHYSKNTTNLYTACGINKWGMTGAMVSAIILSDMVTGVKNDFAEIFNPSRNIIKPQLFINGFEATKNLLTITNKRCPHLGCGLKWNPAEHSWDCPCHGSRFSEKGKVIDNPANGDLHRH